MVEMRVIGLAIEGGSKAPILVLRDPLSERLLPIWIGASEAIAISLALKNLEMPRPLTHDLLLNCINALGGGIRHVEIPEVCDGAYSAVLFFCGKDGQSHAMDSRPSDAVAIALRAKKPIFLSRDVLEEAGVRHFQLLDAGIARLFGPEESPEFLATLFSLHEAGRAGTQRQKAEPPRVTVTVTPALRKSVPQALGHSSLEERAKAVPAGPLRAGQRQTETNLEELLRQLDPETKYRM